MITSNITHLTLNKMTLLKRNSQILILKFHQHDPANKKESLNPTLKYQFFMLMSTWTTQKNKESLFMNKMTLQNWLINSVKNTNLEIL